ncbi:MAG: UDP-2,3-diacylglucosamine diphosphatase LpxI [Leptospiraceae bacterium]|nr:LpxI family protein [Leptospiraceae bacterium]MCK6382180.1 UDP-2,3-diacylglucosamine diphosphatase LpxI [Leptospiraceae bacterium]
MGRLGILAGGGELPFIGMKEALSNGEDPIFLGIRESDFQAREFEARTVYCYIAKIGKLIQICKKEKIDRLLLLGKIKKELLFRSLKYDLKAITLLAKMINKHDYTIFKIISDEFLKNKIEILSQKKYLQSLLLSEGRYTKKKLSKDTLCDIKFGMDYAKKLTELDIGQTVVVFNQTVLAVEAVEGTDETILRGGKLSNKKGGVVCKSAKKNQDDRFDLPGIGIHTLQYMKESGCSTLAFHAGEALVVNPKEVIDFAEKNKIDLVSYGESGVKILNGSQKNI